MITPVILSGGSGTRLWPLSREAYPKQFIPLSGDNSLFQNTVLRLSGLGADDPLVVCNEEHRFLVREQLAQIDATPAGILLEPVGRNTAPAIACTALHASKNNPEALLLVMPSDHVIEDTDAFQQSIRHGMDAAQEGSLITFGIVPTCAETGYGYIRRSTSNIVEHAKHFEVDRFTEKPDVETAQAFLDSGDYFWNSGIFLFRADRYLASLQEFRTDIYDCSVKAYAGLEVDNGFLRLDVQAFTDCPSQSIDYAVMEKTDDAAVVPMDAGWNDLGAWPALGELADKDTHGNIAIGDVMTHNARNNYIRSTRRLVSALGVDNTIIVETADAVLVADRAHAQDVKAVVESLKAKARDEAIHHVCIYRPWGSFETIDEGPGFKVKRIIVKPGASLSLQLHHQRAEHWVIVRGEARVTKGEEVFTLEHDQSTYIPMETKHRLENPGEEPLEIIEVQTGAYLGEDDIERFADNYGR